jgi:hypothetical protein
MAVTVPTCASGNAAGTAIQDYMTAFHAAFAAAPGNFTLSNVTGGPVTSFTVTHSAGWQINYRVSGGAILSVFAPSGGIADSAAPGTPTNSYAEDTILPSPSGTSTRWQFAQYGDAVLFAVNGSANTFSQYAFHQGAIFSPGDADNASLGLGTLAYLPTDTSAATPFVWHCTSGTAGSRKSYVRISASVWAGPAFPIALVNFNQNIAGKICSQIVTAPDSGAPSTFSPVRGLHRYLQIDTSTTAGLPLSVLPSTASNQAWLRLNNSATATRQVVLWNKLVTP